MVKVLKIKLIDMLSNKIKKCILNFTISIFKIRILFIQYLDSVFSIVVCRDGCLMII